MKYIYYLAAIVLIFSVGVTIGWIKNEERRAKQTLKITQDHTNKFIEQQVKFADAKRVLEDKIVKDSEVSEQRLRKYLKENSQLKESLNLSLSNDVLTYARLCDEDSACALLRRPPESPAEGQGLTPIDLAWIIRELDTRIEKHNLEIVHQSEQIKSCY